MRKFGRYKLESLNKLWNILSDKMKRKKEVEDIFEFSEKRKSEDIWVSRPGDEWNVLLEGLIKDERLCAEISSDARRNVDKFRKEMEEIIKKNDIKFIEFENIKGSVLCKSENKDIGNLIAKIFFTDKDADILSGLVFGYPPKEVLAFVEEPEYRLPV